LFVAMRPSKQRSGPWVIWTPRTPLVCLAQSMIVGFKVLGLWEKSHSGTRCLQKHIITLFANENKRQLCEDN
jgi:hypothetical protein